MKRRKAVLFLIANFLALVMFAGMALADKASVSIEAPADAVKGSEIIIRLTITHSGNNFFHYVEWVKVWVNSQEFMKWEYSASKRPEEATFTKEIKYTVKENLDIKSEASCNIHGSKGPAILKVSVKE